MLLKNTAVFKNFPTNERQEEKVYFLFFLTFLKLGKFSIITLKIEDWLKLNKDYSSVIMMLSYKIIVKEENSRMSEWETRYQRKWRLRDLYFEQNYQEAFDNTDADIIINRSITFDTLMLR